MKRLNRKLAIGSGIIACALSGAAQTPPPQPADILHQRLQQMQQATARNEQQLRTYQWIESVTVAADGRTTSPKQSICRYAEDGTVLKTPLAAAGASTPPGMAGPMRGGPIMRHVAEEKEKKVLEEVQDVQALTRLYLPLNRVKLAEVLHNGRVDFEHDGENGDAIILNNYAKPGDQMRLTLSRTRMQISGISIKSYLDKPNDQFLAAVHFAELPDGTMYPALTSLQAPSKKLTITTTEANFSRTID